MAETDDAVQDEMLEKSYDLNDIHERMREIDAHTAEARAQVRFFVVFSIGFQFFWCFSLFLIFFLQKILFGLGFSNEEVRIKKTKEYSGGWRMRIALACALVCPSLSFLPSFLPSFPTPPLTFFLFFLVW